MRILSWAVLVCLIESAALAQDARGSFTGRVLDASGATIPGTKVVATNIATNVTVSSTTNDSGIYVISYLIPGVYRVTAEAAGFKQTVREQVELQVGERVDVGFQMELGPVNESVQVQEPVSHLETETGSVGAIMTAREITSLPINGGNAFYLSRLTAGVTPLDRGNGQDPADDAAGVGSTVNGVRGNSSEATLDGVPNMYNAGVAFSPPADMVEEFKINTAAYDASLGHAAGAVINVSMKSGTNHLHGTSYYRDSRLRARPWFLNRFLFDPTTGPIDSKKIQQNSIQWLKLNWGQTLSGPVVLPKLYDGHNRTFWTFGYEGFNTQRQPTFTGSVPTAAERGGDFSALLALGARYQIYDPDTVTPAAGGRFSRLPLAGNLVPASRQSPIAKKILEYYPAPNTTGTVDGLQNFFRVQFQRWRWNSWTSRVDHNISERHRVFARFYANLFSNQTQPMPTIASGTIDRRPGYGGVLDDVYVVNPRLLVNLHYGITFQNPFTQALSQGFDFTSLGLPASLMDEIRRKGNLSGLAFPQIAIDSFTTLGTTGGTNRVIAYQTFAGTVTKVAGSHSVRAGAEFRLLRENAYNFGNLAPTMTFGSDWTRGPLDTAAAAPVGQGLAALLFGLPSSGRIDLNASQAEQSTFTGLFLQDDWKIASRLTLNLGLRYEFEGPTTERFNRTVRGYDSVATNPIEAQARANYASSPIPEVPLASFHTIGGLTFAGVGQPRKLWSGDRNNFAPRFGFAYQLSRRVVLRGGYGIFYDLLGVDRQDVNQGGFNQPTNLVPSLNNGQTFIATLANPFPNSLDVPQGAAAGLRTFLGRNISYFYERPLNPYMQRWSFSAQTSLPFHIFTDLTYVGNRGTKLSVSREIDPVSQQYLSKLVTRDQTAINFLTAQVTNPFFGIADFTGSNIGGQTVARNQLLRPYPQFSSITLSVPSGYSYYHSLQVTFQKRVTHGLSLWSTFSYSRFMEAISYLNPTDTRPEKVVSLQDIPLRWTFSPIWELPFGKGRRFFGSARKLNLVVGGWQVQALYEGQSGQPLGFGNAIFNGDLHNIPIPVEDRRAERWFNVDAGFERNSGRALANNIIYLPSRYPGVRGDGINNLDMSAFKTFRISERIRAQFRAESYNLANHVQFANPNTNTTATAFGTITGEKGHGQRQFTFSWKLLY